MIKGGHEHLPAVGQPWNLISRFSRRTAVAVQMCKLPY